LPLLGALCAGVLAACGGGGAPPDSATKNRVFYDWAAASGDGAQQYEQRWPPLDLAESPENLEYLGVTIVRGGVHLSRPKSWMIREASNEPGHAFIQYVSPRAFSFAIYERVDSPTDLWREVLNRYEDDVASVGAKVTGKRVPMATLLGQGRSFSVERKVDAAKRPFISHAREFIVRGEHRLVLVQIVHGGEDLSAVDAEIMRAVSTLEVL
jgi:hypothetical protein